MEVAKKVKRPGIRKPAHLELAGGKGSRQRVWEAIRKHSGAFTSFQIARKSGVHDETVSTYLFSLGAAGYLKGEDMTGKPAKQWKTWTLEKDNGIEAPRVTRDGKPVTQGLGMESMWRTMRIIGDFNAAELAAHASACGINVSPASAKDYAGALRKAGYLVVVAEATRRPGLSSTTRFRLGPGKYTGPRPPMIQRTSSLYDPNLCKVVWQEEPINVDDL